MFDKVYVIHLPDEARKASIEKEIANFGLPDPEFVHAKTPHGRYPHMRRNPAVEMGCNLSHLKAIIHAGISGATRPLFLEDDVGFKLDEKSSLRAAESALAGDFDVLYLGGHPRGKIKAKISENLVQVGLFSFAEAYCINGASIQAFLDYWLDRIGRPHAMFDFILGEFAELGKGYCVYPTLTYQKPFMSLISRKVDNKSNLLLNGWSEFESMSIGPNERYVPSWES